MEEQAMKTWSARAAGCLSSLVVLASVAATAARDGTARSEFPGHSTAKPVQQAEPFGLVLVEAMACGTPVAALDRGAVSEVVDDGVTGRVFQTLDELVSGLPDVMRLDRRRVRDAAVRAHGVDRMVDDYVAAYRRVLDARRRPDRPAHA